MAREVIVMATSNGSNLNVPLRLYVRVTVVMPVRQYLNDAVIIRGRPLTRSMNFGTSSLSDSLRPLNSSGAATVSDY